MWTLQAGNLIYQVHQRPEEHRATVTGYVPGSMNPVPILDLTFTQEQGRVVIETRLSRLVGGNGPAAGARHIDEKAWPTVKKCTGGTIELTQ
jgi:hypothetical protein